MRHLTAARGRGEARHGGEAPCLTGTSARDTGSRGSVVVGSFKDPSRETGKEGGVVACVRHARAPVEAGGLAPVG